MSIASTLSKFVAGFNTNSLDEVMTYFAEDAVYQPGDGRQHRGRAAIREAFRPQFAGAFGTMTFLVDDQAFYIGSQNLYDADLTEHGFAHILGAGKYLDFRLGELG